MDVTTKLTELRKTKASIDEQLARSKTELAVAEAELARVQEEIKREFNCETVAELEAKLMAFSGEIQATDKLLGEALQLLGKKDYAGVVELLGGAPCK